MTIEQAMELIHGVAWLVSLSNRLTVYVRSTLP